MMPSDLSRLEAAFPWPASAPTVAPDWGPRWFSDDEQWGHIRLFKMLVDPNARTIVELGSFVGRSTAGWLKAFPQAHVIAIDTWQGSSEHQTNPQLSNLLPKLFPTFQANLWDQRRRVTAIRATTLDGMQQLSDLGSAPDVIYIDADHSTDAVIADLSKSLDLFPAAQIIGDDWTRPTVRAGVETAATLLGFRFAACRNVWWIPRVSSRQLGESLPAGSGSFGQKVVTVTLYRRHKYTQIVLDALAACDGIDAYHVIMHLEPGYPEVLRAAQQAKFARKTIVENGDRLGCSINTRCALDHGFQHADYVVHLEDDTVPARDCLRYFEWANEKYRNDPEVFTVSAYSRNVPAHDQWKQVVRTPWFTPWGWATWRDRWAEIAPHLGAIAWGHCTNRLRGDRVEVRPLLARCQNIGSELGEHCPSPEFHRQNHFNEFGAWSVHVESGQAFRED